MPQTPTPLILLTPETPGQNMSDVESLSSETNRLTPNMSSMNLGKKRGRPKKKLEVPSMDDYPYDRSREEKTKYVHKKLQTCGSSIN